MGDVSWAFQPQNFGLPMVPYSVSLRNEKHESNIIQFAPTLAS